MRRLSFALCGLLFCTAPLFAQRDLKDIPSPDPELERATFVLPEGFEVNLFAADPQIAKPIQMNFDPQGRLWIVSSEVYPQIEPGKAANDKVLIVEDKDHDGTADSTFVFADGLLIPTGIAPGDGGAYVGASTELLFLKDTNGDGKADHRRVVLSGFGTEDTHHIIHTFRWGPEQLLYFSQSIYIHSHLETPWGVKRLNAGGIWQMRPENLKLDIILRGLVNTWGTAWDQWGATFATDGAGGEGINYVVPGASYTTAYGAARILRGLNPGSPKDCGLEIVSGAHLPDDWQGSLITNDFRGHRVCRYVLKEQGSGYLSQEQQEVIRSNHVAFRPIDVKQGPDGAIYIADWYNPIIQHGEVDFRDPRRDKVHGRIWRVTYKGKPPVKPTTLVGASTEDLLNALQSPEGFVRQQAKRVLRERALEGKQDEVVKALAAWTHGMDNTAPGYHRARLEGLWMYVGLDVVEPELLGWLLRCNDHHVRAAATRVIGHWLDRLPNAMELLQQRVTDSHPQVRLEAVRVLGRVQEPRAIELAALALDKDMDEWLDYALWLTSRELQPVWQPALSKGEITFGNNARHLAFVLKSAGSPEAVPALVKMLVEKQVQEADRSQVLDVVGEFGRPEALRSVFDLAVASQDPVLLGSLIAAHGKRNVQPSGDLSSIAPLLKSDNGGLRGLAARAVGAWHIDSQRESLQKLIDDPDRGVADAAILGLADFGGEESIKLLQTLSTSEKTFRPAIIGLLKHRPNEAAKAFVAFLQDGMRTGGGGTEDAALASLFGAFLQRKDGAGLLVAALKDQKIKADAAVIGQRAIAASGQPHEALAKILAATANVSTGPKVLSPEQMAKEIEFVQAHGNAARGEAIFRRAELNCFKCHSVGDAGGQVGPNLVSLGATAQLDYVINSLLDPSKNIKEGFTTVVVVTDEGKVLSGVKLRESDTDVILRDAEDRELSIPKNRIEEQKAGASIMPVGLSDRLTQAEQADLVAFLAALGKQPEFTIKPEAVVRRWQVLQSSEPAANAIRRTSYATAATDDPAFQWLPHYSTVAGALPLRELPILRASYALKPGERGASYVRTEIEVLQTGKCRIVVTPPAGVAGWLDDKPFDPTSDALIDLPAGRHRVTLAINRDVAGDGPVTVRVATPEKDGATVKLVGGK